MSLLSRISPLFISALLTVAGTLLPVGHAYSQDYYWVRQGAPNSPQYPSAQAACGGNEMVMANATTASCLIRDATGWVYTSYTVIRAGNSCSGSYDASTGYCAPPVQCPGDSTRDPVTNSCVLECQSPLVPNAETSMCEAPPNNCQPGQFMDFDTMQCKWPQDDTCSVIGASWNNNSQACQCGAGKLLVTAGGVSRCMDGGDNSCSSNSPDFKGYGPTGQPVCDASARCLNGGQPGYVGSGDQMSVVCIPPPGDGNGSCNGVQGVMNGVSVCIPNPGDDPDLPNCNGVVGTVGNEKVCIEPADNNSRCKPGETAGYVGVGAEMKFVCVPKGYGPQTCPPGQYIINMEAGGFGCVTASNDPPSGTPGNTAGGKTPGKITGNSTTTTKDGNGNATGSSESDLNLNIEGLFHDAPENNFTEEMNAFGSSALDSAVDVDSITSKFGGRDGAFTSRSSLDNASSFVKAHTIGNAASCSGTMPFLGYEISCSKFENMNRVLGWLVFVTTLVWIYNTLMSKRSEG